MARSNDSLPDLPTYRALEPGQVRDALVDNLRQAEYAHLQATLAVELAGVRGDDTAAASLSEQAALHQKVIDHLARRVEAFPDAAGAGG